jgi:paraquat-inducible protein B
VLGWDLDDMARHATVHAFVRAPFDRYVHDDSLFWNASGLSIRLAGTGLQVQMESIRALLLGGIAFDTRPDPRGPASTAGYSFPLYANYEAAQAAGFGRQMHLMSVFEGSVSGLAVGADVTLHGLKIGEVTDIGLMYDPSLDSIVVPVAYRVEGERIAGVAALKDVPLGTVATEMVKRGFRATLQSPSLISGDKIVAIEMVPGAPPAEMKREGDVFVVPSSQAGGFDSMTRSANELLSKINRIDFAAIGHSVVGTFKGLDDTVNGPQLKKTLGDLEMAMASVKETARKLETGSAAALDRLPEISAQLEKALIQVNRLVASVNTGYGNDSRFNRDINRLLAQLNDTARSFRALADLLSRNPEALIKGRAGAGGE